MSRRDTYQQAMNAAKRNQARLPEAPHIPKKHVPYERPVLTQEEKDAMEARAKLALRAEWEYDKKVRETAGIYMFCEFCGQPAVKRTLCLNHYQLVLRSGELNQYPTKQFLEDPTSYGEWLIGYFPEVLDNLLAQKGFRLESID